MKTILYNSSVAYKYSYIYNEDFFYQNEYDYDKDKSDFYLEDMTSIQYKLLDSNNAHVIRMQYEDFYYFSNDPHDEMDKSVLIPFAFHKFVLI